MTEPEADCEELMQLLVILDGWMNEVQKYERGYQFLDRYTNFTLRHLLPETLSVHKYHGPKRDTDVLRLREYDLILTTYATVSTEFSGGTSVLHRMNFFRLVLDEGRSARLG